MKEFQTLSGRRPKPRTIFWLVAPVWRAATKRAYYGKKAREDVGELVLQIPAAPVGWQFLFDILPAQLAAERLARLSGVDCDSFRICSYIVQGEYGLITEQVAAESGEDAI